jgi:hypothetical protein
MKRRPGRSSLSLCIAPETALNGFRTAGILFFEHYSNGSLRLDLWLTKADRNIGLERLAFLQARSLVVKEFKVGGQFHCVALSPPWSAPDVLCALHIDQTGSPGMSRWLYDPDTEQWVRYLSHACAQG